MAAQVFEKDRNSHFVWQDCEIIKRFDSGDVQVKTVDGGMYFVHESELRYA